MYLRAFKLILAVLIPVTLWAQTNTTIRTERDDTAPATCAEGAQCLTRGTTNRAVHTNLRDASGTELGTAGDPVNVEGTIGCTLSEPISVDDNGSSLTVDGTVACNLNAGTNNIGDVDVLTVPAPLSTTGNGTAATALRVTVASDSTGILSVSQFTDPWSIDGTVDNVELPSASVLSDNFANPTTSQIGAFGMLWDGVTWDRTPGTSADGMLCNLGTNNDVTVTSGTINIGTFPDNEPINVAQMNGVAVSMGSGINGTGVQRVTLATDDELNDDADAIRISVAAIDTDTTTIIGHVDGIEGLLTTIDTDTGNIDTSLNNIETDVDVLAGWDNAASDGASISGDVAHDAADAGEPAKIGGKAFNFAPSEGVDPGQTAVAANDRVNGAFDLNGLQPERVYATYHDLDNISTTYDDSPTTAVSQDIACEKYRCATLVYTITKANTPTHISFEVEVSADGTNFFDLVNGPLGSILYDDTAVGASGISRALHFCFSAQEIRVRVTATGTDATNTFTVASAALYLRN